MASRKGKEATKQAESSLVNFLAGVEATFGCFLEKDSEYKDFLLSAQEFYCDYKGTSSSNGSRKSRLPFWRYLIYCSGAGLDEAAALNLGEDDRARTENGGFEALAAAMKGYWPLIPALITRIYKDPAPLRESEGDINKSSKFTNSKTSMEYTQAGLHVDSTRLDIPKRPPLET